MKTYVIEFVNITIAVIIASLGLKLFLLPNGILDGGATGIAILMNSFIDLNISFIILIVSIPFFIIGYFVLNRKIIIKSCLAVTALSAMLYFENFEKLTDDKLIICTFGGLLLGVGIGLAIKNGAVLDGSEILGIWINEKYGISIGSFILSFNLFLFGITAYLINIETALYSTLTYFITSKSVDLTIKGFENYIGLMIVSTRSTLIQLDFAEKFGNGITIYKGAKGFGKKGVQENLEIIHVIVNRIDKNRLMKMIRQIDHEAFIIEFDVNHVTGGKLNKYLSLRNS